MYYALFNSVMITYLSINEPGSDGEGERPEHGRGADDEGHPEGEVIIGKKYFSFKTIRLVGA
jgi:hypothetical protein